MNVRTRILAAGAAAAACCLIGMASFAGDQKSDHSGKNMQGAPDKMMEEAMQRCAAMGEVNENHEYLKKWAGEWNLKCTFWMAPGAPPMTNELMSTSKMAFGDHYLIEKISGQMDMGDGTMAPFEGMAIMGYDNHKQKYFTTWMDSMSSGLMQEWGDRKGDAIVTMGEAYNPMYDAVTKSRSVATVIDSNTRKLEMFNTTPDGSTTKVMEILYTRK